MNQRTRRPRVRVTVRDPGMLYSTRRQAEEVTIMGDKDAGAVKGKAKMLFIRGREKIRIVGRRYIDSAQP